MTFHQSCEFNTFRNNPDQIPDRWCIIHTSLLTSTPDTRLTLLLWKRAHYRKKRESLQGSCYANTFKADHQYAHNLWKCEFNFCDFFFHKIRQYLFQFKSNKGHTVNHCSYYIFVSSLAVNQKYDVAILSRMLVDHKLNFHTFCQRSVSAVS